MQVRHLLIYLQPKDRNLTLLQEPAKEYILPELKQSPLPDAFDGIELLSFQGGGCYLLLGNVEVDYHFPTITVIKIAKMPFIADPRYTHDKQKQYDVHRLIQEDVSMTHHKPYPQEHEIGLPRRKINEQFKMKDIISDVK